MKALSEDEIAEHSARAEGCESVTLPGDTWRRALYSIVEARHERRRAKVQPVAHVPPRLGRIAPYETDSEGRAVLHVGKRTIYVQPRTGSGFEEMMDAETKEVRSISFYEICALGLPEDLEKLAAIVWKFPEETP